MENNTEILHIITYPGIKNDKYLISSTGKVFIAKTGKEMKTYLDKDLYEKITLVTNTKHPTKRGNKSKHYFIHRLVAWEFLGHPIDSIHNFVNHKNGITYDNRVENLEWCTILENTNHAKYVIKHMNASGVNSPVCKYSEEIIRFICKCLEDGISPLDILDLLLHKKMIKKKNREKVRNLIYKINKKCIFHDIISEYNFKTSLPLVSKDETVNIIRKFIYHNKTNYEILYEFGYKDINDNRQLYDKIIYQRSICKLMFNDYRKDELIKAFGTE